eukprot:TRINITY_DN5978_c0_g1_i1.p1 TRINITY_DN5978_c0_g1~~TRINITY_DN5978_c0_g1_i1.p1  ORF type:complete len:920 (+),score=90.68 TRINITY_DN5978_c0_g1_i1:136-2760(+)
MDPAACDMSGSSTSSLPFVGRNQPGFFFQDKVVRTLLMLDLSCVVSVMIWSWGLLYFNLLEAKPLNEHGTASDEQWCAASIWVVRVAAGIKAALAIFYYVMHTRKSGKLYARRKTVLGILVLDVSILPCVFLEGKAGLYSLPCVTCIGVLVISCTWRHRVDLARRYVRLSDQGVNLTSLLQAIGKTADLSKKERKTLSAIAKDMHVQICGSSSSPGIEWSCDTFFRFLREAEVHLTHVEGLSWITVDHLLLDIIKGLTITDESFGAVKDHFDVSSTVGSSFWHLRKGSPGQLLIFIFLSLIDAFLVAVVQSWLVGRVTDSVTIRDVEMAKYQLLAYIGSYLLDGFVYVLQARSSSVCLAASTACLQRRAAGGMLSMGSLEHRLYPSGSINATFSSDIARLDALWQAFFWAGISTVARIVVAIIYTLWLNPPVGVLAITVFPLIFSTIPQSRSSAAAARQANASAATISMFQNGVENQRYIWSCDHQTQWLRQFLDPLVAEQERANDQSKFTGGLVQAYAAQLVTLFAGVHIAIFGWLAVNGVMTVSQFTQLLNLFAMLSSPVRMLAGFFRTAVTMAGSAQRVEEFIHATEAGLRRVQETSVAFGEVEPATKRDESPGGGRHLTVGNVSFAYPEAMSCVISNVSLRFKPGQFVAIVGDSGCGKSTLLSLIMTWLTPCHGSIRLDSSDEGCFGDVHVNADNESEISVVADPFDGDQRHLREVAAVVFQETMLIHSTLHDNIAFGSQPTTNRKDVEWAASAAGILEFISTLPQGFDTELGGAGSVSLSGGQAQRVCIARALCRKPALLLLDEATSALDRETEHQILKTISTLRSDYPREFSSLIVVSITHHPDTLQYADVVVRLEKGGVAYCGRPSV